MIAKIVRVLGFTAFVTFASTGNADSIDLGFRDCSYADLAGKWSQVNLKTNYKYTAQEIWFYPYQKFVFTPDHKFKHTTSPSPIDPGKESLWESAPYIQSFNIDQNGIIQITHESSGDVKEFLCTYNTENIGATNSGAKTVNSGDIMLKEYYHKDNVVVIRQLRREG